MSRMSRILDFIAPKDETLTYPTPQWPPPPSPPSSSLQITPAILLTIIILSAIFFLSGLIHLLIRFFTKMPSSSQPYLSSSSSSTTTYADSSGAAHPLQRQLHELFQLHDSGLDQTAIDALPIFYYDRIIGLKEPSDCAVCLCEFSDQDKLRLLPNCSHAFHVRCIDTWLLSSSSCPLCRGSVNETLDVIDEEESDLELGFGGDRKRVVNRVFSVRLGKFRRFDGEGEVRSDGEGSGRCVDSRRCYSMGSNQYIVGDLDLQVALSWRARQQQSRDEEGGMRINGRWSRSGDSFSISKIWLWPKNNSSSSSRFSSSLWSMQLPIDNVMTMQNNNEALD